MRTTFTRRARRRGRMTGTPVLSMIAVATLLVSLAFGGQITLFQDDFQDDELSTDPGTPPIGEPWEIQEFDAEGISVAVDELDPDNRVLQFGIYRNIAEVPFSAVDQQRIALAKNATVSFDYIGYGEGGSSHFFDVGIFDPFTGDPALLIRVDPWENQDLPGAHDLHYLDPVDGLVDTGLDVFRGNWQTISIAADFAEETFDLQIGEATTTDLPMLMCPADIAGVQFANYSIAMGSGAIDNLSVTLTEPDSGLGSGSPVPELGSMVLLFLAGITLACAWILRRKTR